MEYKLTLSLKFAIFDLKIEHQTLSDLGEFTIFCMEAINKNMSLSNISNIIQLNEELIKRQLVFSISRKYLRNDYSLTEKGVEIVELLQLIKTVNQAEIKIALEQYVENNSKKIYSVENGCFEQEQRGVLIKDSIYDYKLQTIFNEILEKDKSKIKSFLFDRFPSYKEIIERHIESLVLTIKKTGEQLFYNHSILDDVFINELKDERSREKTYISVEIPILEVNKTAQSSILDKKTVDEIQEKFEKNKYFNLINGKAILYQNGSKKNSNLSLEAKIEKNDIVRVPSQENIPVNELLFIELKTDIRELVETKFFDITDILEKI